MSIEVIQYPLTTALEGNKYPLAKDYRATLWKIYAICKKLPIPSEEFVRGLPIISDTL
jgi:hypothetical protein